MNLFFANSFKIATFAAMNQDLDELLTAIRDVYGRDTFTMGELSDILMESGFRKFEIRRIIRFAIEKKQMGRVSYRKLGRAIPASNTYVVLRPNPQAKPKDI